VTGGTRGIGRSISVALAREGCRVYAIYARNRRAARCLAEEAQVEGWDVRCLRADLRDEARLQSVVSDVRSESEGVDIVVHSAASGVHRDVLELTARHLSFTFETNVYAIHLLLRGLVPMMSAGGRIVGLTSEGATRVCRFYGGVGSSKGALEALFRHYAWELAPRGIAVNLVCPGLVATDAVNAFPDRDTRVAHAISGTPTGRLSSPEDVAAVVSFLCSPAAGQIVGETIVVDGGRGLSA
jgi:enoyl-[acyl-carrier protein] reductase III